MYATVILKVTKQKMTHIDAVQTDVDPVISDSFRVGAPDAVGGVVVDTTVSRPVIIESLAPADTSMVEGYFDRFMSNPSWGNLEGDETRHNHLRSVFTGLVADHFDLDVLMKERYPGHDRNPILGELAGIMASIDHNAGVYYSAEDTADLFTVIAGHMLEGDELRQRLQQATETGNVHDMDMAVRQRVGEVSSIDHAVSLAVVKDESGQWRVADEREFTGKSDFEPLQIIRQDNPDKGGWNKFRVRQSAYTRTKDELHTQQVGDGWFASDWIEEPNYWAAQLRAAIADGAFDAVEKLQTTGTSVLFVTEGGVLKGTATPGTDVDTTCVVIGDLSNNFGDAQTIIEGIFTEKFANVPFVLKKGEEIRPVFFDRSSDEAYYLNPETGKYWASGRRELVDGRYIYQIRDNEKGIGVTGAHGFIPYKKPTAENTDSSVDVSIDLQTGDVRALSETESADFRNHQEITRLAASSADNVVDNWFSS